MKRLGWRPVDIVFADDLLPEATPDRLAVRHGALGAVGAGPRVPADRPENLAADGAPFAVYVVTIGGVL